MTPRISNRIVTIDSLERTYPNMLKIIFQHASDLIIG